MNTLDEHIQHLVIAYLEGTATEEETVELWQWVERSEENYRQLMGLQEYWVRAGCEERYDVDKAFEGLKARLSRLAAGKRRQLRLRRWCWAAVVALLLASGGLYWLKYAPANRSVQTEQIVPGSNKAILVMGENRRVVLDEGTADAVFGDSSEVRKEGDKLVYEAVADGDTAVSYNRLITPRGGEYTVVLADGTQVWLNAESELTYPVRFAGSERRVFLKGEAYFDVAKCEGKKFIVSSGNTQVSVLGTEFNVKGYEDGQVAATLVEGAVVVRHEEEECRLKPGEQAVVREDGIKVAEVETVLYTAWKDGFFIYREASLDAIMQELARWYDFTYFYQNSGVADLNLTAKLRKFDQVEDVFEILEMTGQVEFVIKNKTVTIIGK